MNHGQHVPAAADATHHLEAPTMAPAEPTPAVQEEPMYVNAKQYNRILKRRDSRARWETVQNVRKNKVPARD
jgi:nuclear transcription factor Y alpha